MRDTCICLLTAHRLDYAIKTIQSTVAHISNPDRIGVHIASDGDDAEYIISLRKAIGDVDKTIPVTVSSTGGGRDGGYGANWNKATQTIHQIPGIKYVLPLEDDWELVRPLNLDQLVGIMEAEDHIGCLRLGYLGFTDYLHITHTHINDIHIGYLLPGSPEKHVFAGHPRLEKISWERSIGPWPEIELISDPASGLHEAIKATGRRLNPGETELAVCRVARTGVVWPFGLIPPELFAHIGTVRSY